MLNYTESTHASTPVPFLSSPTHVKSKKPRTSSSPNSQLRYHRKMRSWTQAKLADELYQLCTPDEECERGVINAKMISRWEQGEYVPSLFWQKKPCTLFGTTPDKLGLLQDVAPISQHTRLQHNPVQQSVSFFLLHASLFEHPDFQKGVVFGREVYHDEYEGILTEEEMVTLIEGELSRRARQREARLLRLINDEPCPLLVHLGVVIGVIDEAMIVSAQEK